MSERPKAVRCAIYTRKSTENNLDLEFNSLDAQRESCEAYIKSQKHEGWQLIDELYEDGGVSAATLDRPDVQRLLEDVKSGKIDVVVIYKIDRLTRSLLDFARLMELFDAHKVSFVSITQAFNTATSMGRLNLNIVMSFAQYEREIAAERVRDKIALSKRRGMFMGGNIPLGYINQNKKLVIVPEEAERVRWIYARYLELGSLGALLEEMNRLDIRTKAQVRSNGARAGGVSFGKGALAYLLKNRAYVGEVAHRGNIYPGEHELIVDRTTFDAVQTALTANSIARKAGPAPSDFLLTGLLYDSAGNRMTPSHSRKKGVRYRYYVSQAILQSRKDKAGAVFRVPAPDVEALIESLIRDRCPGNRASLGALVQGQIARITILPACIEIAFRDDGMALAGASAESANPDGESSPPSWPVIRLPWSKKPFRADKGIASEPSLSLEDSVKLKDFVLRAITKARCWVDRLVAGETLANIAKEEGRGERQIRQLMPLAFVAPTTLRDIIEGRLQVLNVTALAKNISLTCRKLPLESLPESDYLSDVMPEVTSMNMQPRKQILSKPELERMVLSYLRMLPGSQHIDHVIVAPRSGARGNWTVIEIEPALSSAADNAARNALRELQGEFILAS